jgi:hypothetical protein
MFDLANPWVLGAWVGTAVLLLGLGTVLFRAGCALADVADPSLLKSFVVADLALVICLPLAWLLVHVLASFEADPGTVFGPMRGLGVLLATGSGLTVAALLYTLLLATPLKKSLMIAATELFLGVLLSSLLAGVILVVLSIVQITHKPTPPPRALLTRPAVRTVFHS